MERLWGDNFFNPKTKKWQTTNDNEGGAPLERAFNQFVLEPIFQLFKNVMNPKAEIETIVELLVRTIIFLKCFTHPPNPTTPKTEKAQHYPHQRGEGRAREEAPQDRHAQVPPCR